MTFPDPQLERQLKLSESHETMGGGGRIEQGGGVKGTTRRPVASANHGASQRLTPSKEHAGTGPRPPTQMKQLGLCVCPLIIGAEAVSGPVACHWIPFPQLST